MIEHEFATLHAAVARGQEQRQFAAQTAQREQQRRPGLDTVVEIDAVLEAVRRLVQRQHFMDDAAHAVERRQRRRPDAPREFRARQGEYIAQRAHADVV